MLRIMMGVANISIDQSSADPLSNLERLIKENSEVQAGAFQLQHEMRFALSERNEMNRELCEVVNKEKELVGSLADLCKKAEQQSGFTESIAQALLQVQAERAEKRTTFSNVEVDIRKLIDVVGDLQLELKKTQLDTETVQSQRNSLIAEIHSEQSSLANAMLSLDEHQSRLRQLKGQFLEMLTAIKKCTSDISLLQDNISDAFVEIFHFQLNSREQIEEIALESTTIYSLNKTLDCKRDQLNELACQIRKYRFLIQKDQELKRILKEVVASAAELSKSLELDNWRFLRDLESEQACKENSAQLTQEIELLEKKWDLLQYDLFTRKKSKNSFMAKSSMLQDQIKATLDDLAATENRLIEKQSNLVLLRKHNQDLLQRRSHVLEEFTTTVQIPLRDQFARIKELKEFNKLFRSTLLEFQNADQWKNIRHDIKDMSAFCTLLHGNRNISDTEDSAQRYDILSMFSDYNLLVYAKDQLDLELQDTLEKLQDLCEKYHEKKEELRTTYQKNTELRDRLSFCKKDTEETKFKLLSKLKEQTALYQQRLKEEELSDVCDLSSVSKEILDDMNDKKLRQARKYNERLSELQAQIVAVSLGNDTNPAESSGSPSDLKRTASTARKLLSKRDLYRLPNDRKVIAYSQTKK